MNKYLWIGSIADKKTESEMITGGVFASAAVNVQRKLLEGLEENGFLFDSVAVYPDFPKLKKFKRVNLEISSRNEKVYDRAISFWNIPILNRIEKTTKLKRYCKKWEKLSKGDNVIIYSLASYLLLGGVCLKKRYKSNVIVIIPDLPEYMSNNRGIFYRLFKKIDRYIINYCLKQLDSMVLFSENMKERLPIRNKPYIVMEGVLSFDEGRYLSSVENRYNNDEKIVMLTGNLDIEEGIVDLLDIFTEIDGIEYKLWLSGTGNAVPIIQEYAKKDQRITYYGYIESYDEFIDTQQRAKVFALMVRPTQPKTPYYFPSKIMEYLVTGGVIICNRIKCIPSEYDEYIHYFKDHDNSIQLKSLLDMKADAVKNEAIHRIGFIKSKSKRNQGKRISELLV